jgi:hypothetical protein
MAKTKEEEVIKKADSLIGKKIGGVVITSIEDISVNGKSLKRLSFENRTTTILNDDDIKNQLNED